MFKKTPEGYRDLLAYKKASAVQQVTENFVKQFSKTKTMYALADQMSRSARSVTKNITEGWKRNTTKEYFQFLGFAIASNAELMEDAGDIVTGVYEELIGIKGVTGGRGIMREENSLGVTGGRGTKGIKGARRENGVVSREELDKIKFYPLDQNLSPAIKLFLMTKEVSFLLYRLQQSLDYKMDQDGTKATADKFRERKFIEDQEQESYGELLKTHGLVRLEDGRVVKKE